jgi:hypothetical protein
MGTRLQGLEHDLRGLESENDEEGTPLTLILGIVVFVVPAFLIILGAAFAAYFAS